ncbi:MAG TPA: hypothetical protein VEA38_12790 [Terriglobales bacterium]|nr:hypothetical protein [Terriglobales bacterium]
MLLCGLLVVRDAALLARHAPEFRDGRFSLAAPGIEGMGRHVVVHEANVLYLAGFREVYDGRLRPGDDYLFETKARVSLAPIVPRLVGGALLALAGGDTDRVVLLLAAAHVVSYIGLFLILRAVGIGALVAFAAAVTVLALTELPELPSSPLVRGLALDRIHARLHDGTGRFIAPALTLPFFLLFLWAVVRDPLLRRRASAPLVGLSGALGFYVYYANFFVTALFLPSYLAIVMLAAPAQRRRALAALLWFAAAAAPFALLVLAARAAGLTEEYVARAGTSRYGDGVHLAVWHPVLLLRYTVTCTLAPLAAAAVLAWRRHAAAAPLAILAGVSFIAAVVPGVLQLAVDLPQPDRIHSRLGAFVNVLTLIVTVCAVAAGLAPARLVALAPVGRAAVLGYVAAVVVFVAHGELREAAATPSAPYAIEPAHLRAVDALRGEPYPCVVASSSRIASSLVTARTPCDTLTSNILLSTATIAEAVERYAAGWALEGLPLEGLLALFHVEALADHDRFRHACVREHEHYYTDGIAMTHHHAPCRPHELRTRLVAAYERYAAEPARILTSYRVDYVFSPGGGLHPAVASSFTATGIPGLFRRLASGPGLR